MLPSITIWFTAILPLKIVKMKDYFLFIPLLIFSCVSGQVKFKIKVEETSNWKSIYYMVNQKEINIKKLDSSKYTLSFCGEKYQYFAIFSIKGKRGWSAIDSNENILFEIYNTSFGEPSPDELVENKIRIIDKNDKIGYADSTGKIIIRPQFEIATAFYKGKAIIGENCEKIPWSNHSSEDGCHHYSTVCKKHGFINEKGEIVQIGDFSFEEIQKKINWKSPEME
jgi:hypothetical protein